MRKSANKKIYIKAAELLLDNPNITFSCNAIDFVQIESYSSEHVKYYEDIFNCAEETFDGLAYIHYGNYIPDKLFEIRLLALCLAQAIFDSGGI